MLNKVVSQGRIKEGVRPLLCGRISAPDPIMTHSAFAEKAFLWFLNSRLGTHLIEQLLFGFFIE
jgi:hypothetical protein